MVINVGLLVHHKINLQNSVDLAAYYGAMKQAEVMNAIGHVNYQIRQSYKLLTWRYRVLGTAGVFPQPNAGTSAFDPGGHPVAKNGDLDNGVRGGSILPGEDYDGINQNPASLLDFYWRPAFCVTFQPFVEVPPRESTCQAPYGQKIDALRKPPIIASFIGASHAALQATILANASMQRNCEFSGPVNYLMLGKYLVAYQIDQADRKRLLYHLANGLSQSEQDFRDLEGDQGRRGIEQTLRKNLTLENKRSLNFEIFNSLGSSSCGLRGGQDQPPKWLAEVMIFPRSSYKVCRYDASGSTYEAVSIDTPPPLTGVAAQLSSQIAYINQMVTGGTGTPTVYRHSLGVEKNPWCMAYVGVQAETEPELPFSLGKIKLKARAFAKPFGARIGPWYGKRYPRQVQGESDSGSNANQIDRRLPIRCVNGNFSGCVASGAANDEATTVNYSRFPGDRFGLASRMVHADYSKSIFDLGKPSYTFWDDIDRFSNARGGEWDILAFKAGNPVAGKFRDLEISAVAPDVFDLTYYSIDPDFHKNYYKDRLERYLSRYPLPDPRGVVRMDIGSRKGSEGFSIRNQMDIVRKIGNSSSSNTYGINASQKFKYLVSGGQNFAHTLTGWISNQELENYEFDKDRFGNCAAPTLDSAPAPGSCIRGGRTGYSVKLVSSDYLVDSHRLGGEGSPQEKLLNPPPDTFVK